MDAKIRAAIDEAVKPLIAEIARLEVRISMAEQLLLNRAEPPAKPEPAKSKRKKYSAEELKAILESKKSGGR